jgi:hypothetical protein
MNDRHHIYPGFRGTDASVHITHNSVRHAVTRREQIYRAIQRCGDFGATTFECAEALSLSQDIVQRQISNLHMRGRIMDSGRRRISPLHGEHAVVWVVSPHSHSPISEAFYGKKKQPNPQFSDMISDLSCFFEAEISQSYHDQGTSPYGRGYREALHMVQIKLQESFESAGVA